VAVSGNFLIDSQMVLAGNPSLIDPTRGQAESEPSDGPLVLEPRPMQRIAGQTGEDLERLYQAYFAIAATLADDQAVPADQAAALQDLADRLAVADDLSGSAQSLIAVIAEHSPQLHAGTIAEARVPFKPISKSILQLAAQARGAEAEASFIHFYCSMVPGGEGDWMQPSEPLANPYWGSTMLRCGINAGQLSPSGIAESAAATPSCCEMTSEPEPAAGPPCCEAGPSAEQSDGQAESKPAAKPSCCDESAPAAPEETES
jgi:membrane fusion protein, copper/silver efflux system